MTTEELELLKETADNLINVQIKRNNTEVYL
jgi:hypothetical protein